MHVLEADGTRFLFLAEIRGKLTSINELAQQHNADFVIHTSTFGFYDSESSQHMSIRTMRHNIITFCPGVDIEQIPSDDNNMREYMADKMSELTGFLDGTHRFNVPVYTTWGAVEDLRVLEKFRQGEYKVENLHILDETTSFAAGGFRICGLGGAFRPSSLFNAGDGKHGIPGSSLSLWVGAWQLGALASHLKETTEPRIFVSHSSVPRNPLLEWFALGIRALYTFSANLHLVNTTVLNRYAVDGPSTSLYDQFVQEVNQEWGALWQAVQPHLETTSATTRSCSEAANAIFELAKEKGNTAIQPYRSAWHFCLSDLSSGYVLGVANEGNLSTEVHSSGREVKRPVRAPAKPVYAIFIKSSLPEDKVLEKIAEEDRPLITKTTHEGSACIVHFSSPNETQKAYDRMDKNDLNSCQIYSPKKTGPSRGRGRRGRGRHHGRH